MIFNMVGGGRSTADATAVAADIKSGEIGYTASGRTVGTGTVIVNYSSIPGSLTTEIITVNGKTYKWNSTKEEYEEIKQTGILNTIQALSVKDSYFAGENIIASVTAYYTNGNSKDVSANATFSPSTATGTSITATYIEDGITATDTFTINIIPSESSFSGSGRMSNEGNGAWSYQCFTSGNFTPPSDCLVDIHLVGGGGSGSQGEWTDYYSRYYGGSGGGGGYTHSYGSIQLTGGTSYPIVVGAGGAQKTGSAGAGNNGGASSAFSYSVNGGNGAGQWRGGDGGSGGGAGEQYVSGNPTAGAENGADAADAAINQGGDGQGRSTYDWWDLDEKTTTAMRAGGGGGCAGDSQGATGHDGAWGGRGGGGYGGSKEYEYDGSAGIANKGGGGGGGYYKSASDQRYGFAGGSGIVLIRTHRNNKTPYYYTGTSIYTQDTETAWTLIVTGSGTFTANEELFVDLYLLGGGQGGYLGGSTSYGGSGDTYYPGGAGGQGGYITIVSSVTLQPGSHILTIGQGGASGDGNVGGTTSFGVLYDAPGGGSNPIGTYQGGAAGGSEGYLNATNTPHEGGVGANSDVADFNGVYRGGGGSGGYSAREDQYSHWSYNWVLNSGGLEGGGLSMTNSSGGGRQPTANYGGGGYGGCNGNGVAGGSGVIIIRTHR